MPRAFVATNAERAAQEWGKVQTLHTAQPEATIHYIHYSIVGSFLYEMYENGELTNILSLTPDL